MSKLNKWTKEGNKHWQKGDLQSAEVAFLSSLNAAKSSGDLDGIKESDAALRFFYSDTGQWQKLDPFIRKDLEDTETRLGSLHSETADQLWMLANNLIRCSRLEEAEIYCRKALGIQEKTLPMNHSDILRSKETLTYLEKLKADENKKD